MNPEKAEGLSPELQRALEPLLAGIESFIDRTFVCVSVSCGIIVG